MFNKLSLGSVSLATGLFMMFAAVPTGTNYKLESYGVGSGGTANSTSTSYALEAISGEVSGTQMTGTTYKGGTGLLNSELAGVPAAPTFTNTSNWYNKLKLVISNGGNASDAVFAVAISTDNFATTQYVKSDFTIGSSLAITDYQTYTAWGGATGVTLVGLNPNTTYYVKVRAMHGKFTESSWSTVSSAATVNPSLTMDLDVSATDSKTSPPYVLPFNDLAAGVVNNSPQKIWLDFTTNGNFGGNVYMYSLNSGLKSAATAYTIAALTGNLAAVQQGFGAQSASATQASGGPLTALSPYNGASDNVGITDTNIRQVYSSATPITSGRASILLKAKITSLAPASTDYTDTLTIIGAASF